MMCVASCRICFRPMTLPECISHCPCLLSQDRSLLICRNLVVPLTLIFFISFEGHR
ncbi:hypothetical protein BS78_08G006800 [Paspalum vaginatum]|nr:hypothetical protein BS78_08G006800 [Paspalum vaginatum]